MLSPGPSDWDSNWCGAHSLFELDSTYLMLYEGNYQIGVNGVQFGLAQSKDLSSWTKLDANPVLKLDSWSDYSLNEPRIYQEGSSYYLFFCSLPYNGIGYY